MIFSSSGSGGWEFGNLNVYIPMRGVWAQDAGVRTQLLHKNPTKKIIYCNKGCRGEGCGGIQMMGWTKPKFSPIFY